MATISPETKEKTKASNKDNAYMSSTCFISRCLNDWFADSGATQHMTDQRDFFTTFTAMSPGSWSVKGISSSNLHVCGYGDIDFFVTVNGAQQTAAIKKVLYVPGLGTNLISIAAVTNVGLSFHFIETRVTF